MTTADAYSHVREDPVELRFHVPEIHCAGCIGKIERGLANFAGVQNVRVNLSLKRLSVTGSVNSDLIIDGLNDLGFDAQALDGETLASGREGDGVALLVRMAVAGFAMMNIMLMSVAVWSGATDATRDIFHLISALIAIPVVAYCAQPFFGNAWTALRVASLNMDVPISLALILAVGMSTYEALHGGAHAYFDAAVSLTFFLLIGRYLDHRTRSAARSAAKELSALESHTANIVTGNKTIRVPISTVEVGDVVRVAAGENIPVDGTLRSGNALLDRSILTGESAPVSQPIGGTVHAGELNLSSPIEVIVTSAAENSSLRQISALVELAENGRNRFTSLADRAAKIYAPAVHLLSLAAFVGWMILTNDLRTSLTVSIAVLIITCPCALALAVPAVSMAAISRLFSQGILVKHATALERLSEVNRVAFDKTGTLTTPAVLIPSELNNEHRSVLLALANSSAHPMSRSIQAALKDVVAADINDICETPGNGITASYQGHEVRLGRGPWLDAEFPGLGFRFGDNSAQEIEHPDALRSGVEVMLDQLGLPSEVWTGDNAASAAALAKKLDLNVLADLRPTDKLKLVESRQAKGERIVMVGDGLNDTAALAAAHASIAPASALDASRNAADIVILNDQLTALPEILAVAKAYVRLSRQNFGIAIAYNLVAVPIALLGFASPLVAALAMSTSSLTVLLNSQRMRWVQ